MHFRHRSRSHDAPAVLVTNGIILPSSPKTLEQILALTTSSPKAVPITGSSDGSPRPHGSSHSASSIEQRKHTSPKRTPTSRKIGFATIRTDSMDTHAAFESDAFAVLMPTTRLPILDQPLSPGKPSSPAARAEAYRTYQEKARQVRERNNNRGIHVPSKLVFYGYDSTTKAGHHASLKVELSPSNSPPSPAGAFPISPPLTQGGWTRTERVPRTPARGARHEIKMSNVSTPRKPMTASKATIPTSHVRMYRADSEAGASPSIPSPIRAHVRPKPVTPVHDRVQTESRYSSYKRPAPPSSSTRSSRSPSPVKTMPNFGCHSSVDGDSSFGYKSRDVSGTVAGASSASPEKGTEKEKTKIPEKEKKPALKRTLTSRWPWLRPSGPRVGKLTTPPVVFAAPSAKPTITSITPAIMSTYIDPFTSLPPQLSPSTPSASRPSSPKKFVHPTSIHSRPSTPQFNTGRSQIQSLMCFLFKICLVLYGLVAM